MNTVLNVTLALATAALVACGGGGGSGGGEPAAPTVNPLAKYVGDYSFCEDHERSGLKIELSQSGALAITDRVDYYAQADCTGALVASESVASATLTYVSTGAATVTGYPSAASVATYSVDRVALSSPARTVTLTGSGVSIRNGQSCIAFAVGSRCYSSPMYPYTQPAESGFAGLVIVGAAIVTLEATSTGYERSTAYPR